MPAALAAADVVVVAGARSRRCRAARRRKRRPWAGRWSPPTVGVLPENVLCPPRMRDELRTGWLVRPGNVGELARAIAAALALDATAYEALGARARQFAEFMFSPQSVAEAIREVYTSLLARDSLKYPLRILSRERRCDKSIVRRSADRTVFEACATCYVEYSGA